MSNDPGDLPRVFPESNREPNVDKLNAPLAALQPNAKARAARRRELAAKRAPATAHPELKPRWEENPPPRNPKDWTRQRCEGVRSVSKARRAKEPPIEQCFGGPVLVDKLRTGEMCPYPIAYRRFDRQALPPAAKWAWSWKHELVLGLIVAATLGCATPDRPEGTKGLVISQAEMAAALRVLIGGCCEKTAGKVLRELRAWNMIASHDRDREDPRSTRRRLRTANRYTVEPFAIEFFDIKPRRVRRKRVRPVEGESYLAKTSPAKAGDPEKSTRCAEEVEERPAEPAGRILPAESEAGAGETTLLDSDATGVKTRPDNSSGSYEPCRANAPLNQPTEPPAPRPSRVRKTDEEETADYAAALMRAHFGDDDLTEAELDAIAALGRGRGGVS